MTSAGCAAPRAPQIATASEVAIAKPAAPAGVQHRLEPGQTLWRLARAYGVAVEELMRVNAVNDPSTLEVGQSIYIPGATVLLEVPPAPALVGGDVEDPAEHPAWLWPVEDGEILSYFGAHRRGHRHTGIDIRGRGRQPVLAAKSGRVVYSSSMRGYGKTVILEHDDGMRTLYAHGSALLVRVGARVRRGQAVARIGRSGNASTEHCHFEIRERDVPINPLRFFSGGERL